MLASGSHLLSPNDWAAGSCLSYLHLLSLGNRNRELGTDMGKGWREEASDTRWSRPSRNARAVLPGGLEWGQQLGHGTADLGSF